MPDSKTISQLTVADNTDIKSTDMIEISVPNGEFGYLSRRVSFEVLANYIVNQLEYSSVLQTTNKKVLTAINEILSSAGGGVELTDTLEAGETSLVFTNNAITATSKIDWYIEEDFYGIVAPTSFTTDAVNHTLTLTFDEQEEDVDIKVVIK